MNTYEYEVTVTGTLIATIQANSLDDAKAEVHEQGGPGLFLTTWNGRRNDDSGYRFISPSHLGLGGCGGYPASTIERENHVHHQRRSEHLRFCR